MRSPRAEQAGAFIRQWAVMARVESAHRPALGSEQYERHARFGYEREGISFQFVVGQGGQRLEDFVRVLAQQGWRSAVAHRRGRELQGAAGNTDLVGRGMGQFLAHATGQHLWILEHIGHVVDGTARHTHGLQQPDPFVALALELLEEVQQLRSENSMLRQRLGRFLKV